MENKFFQKNNPKRHKLVQALGEIIDTPAVEKLQSVAKSVGGKKMSRHDVKNYVQSLDQLKSMLHSAFQLELSTIPPYLCGLYTIREGSSIEASNLIRSVVVEEMLHMVLVANILNSITDPKTIKPGDKLFKAKDIIPSYPTPLPGNIVPEVPEGSPPFQVQLLKFSPDALSEFCTIERPADPDQSFQNNTFDSIGQFYQAIRYGIKRLNKNTPGGIFVGDPARQITPDHYYGSGGKIIPVFTYDDAEEAIAEIVGQGEGIDGTIVAESPMFGEEIEYAHYFKFQEISYGRMYNANDTNFQMPINSVPTGRPISVSWSSVYNMRPNPKMKDYKKDPELYKKAYDFNKVYVNLINNIIDAVSGQPDQLTKGITVMYDLKYKALELLNTELEDGDCAGPTFEYVD